MTHKGENYSVKLQKYYFCNGTENLGKQSTTIDSSFMKIMRLFIILWVFD